MQLRVEADHDHQRIKRAKEEKILLSFLLFTFLTIKKSKTTCSLTVFLLLQTPFLHFRPKQPNDVRNSPKDLPTFNDATRKFNGAKDVSRDFSISHDNMDHGNMSDQAFACSASSVESLPSASGSSEIHFVQSNANFQCQIAYLMLNFFRFLWLKQALKHWFVPAVRIVHCRPTIVWICSNRFVWLKHWSIVCPIHMTRIRCDSW